MSNESYGFVNPYSLLKQVRLHRARKEQIEGSEQGAKRKAARLEAGVGGVYDTVSRNEDKPPESIEQNDLISTEAIERWEIVPSSEEIDRMNVAWDLHVEKLKVQALARWARHAARLKARRKRWKNDISPEVMRRLYGD